MNDRSIALRRRSGWEAADMGILLWRQNVIPLLLSTGIPMALTLLVALLLPDQIKMWAMLVFWWLKPLFDRLALQIVSVRFFDASCPARRLFHGFGKSLFYGLFGDMFWRRLSPFRSAHMPVAPLEHVRGKALGRRKRILKRSGPDFAFLVTFICLSLETVLLFGEMLFSYSMIELVQQRYYGAFLDFLSENTALVYILSCFNSIIIEPLYVCMGFALYINARVETEGWDIELLFRECSLGAKSVSPSMGKSAALALLAAALIFFPCRAACAQTEETAPSVTELLPPPLPQQQSKYLEETLDSPDFGREETSLRIHFKKSDGEKKKSGKLQPWRPELKSLRDILALALRAALVLIIAAALVFALRYALKHFRPAPGASRYRGTGIPQTGEDPEKLLALAADLHGAGKIREGWACCFRAFIAAFSKRGCGDLCADATEYESLAKVKNAFDADVCSVFERFVPLWVAFAYGGLVPESGFFEKALENCKSLCGVSLAAAPGRGAEH